MAQCLKNLPLSLYIHLPWCVKKCPYCDFNSHALSGDIPDGLYVEQLLRDLEQNISAIGNRKLSSIFIGGGTPSLFSGGAIRELLTNVKRLLPFETSEIEITLEANPGTVEQKNFADYREAGVNRLSLGVQSFNNEALQRLGRIHNSQHAHAAIETALASGFERINIDLMYGLPQQTLDEALLDLRYAIDTGATHISWYQLTIEPNTLFYKSPPPRLEDDELWDMQNAGWELLKQSGFEHYEVSAFCKEKNYSQHNLNYWLFGDYLGIGAGAHGKISNLDTGNILRTWKLRHPKQYLAAKETFVGGEKIISEHDLCFEFMLNVLRLYRPFSRELFETRTGLAFNVLAKKLQQALKKGLLLECEDGFQATSLGYRFLNDLQSMFL